jgi:diguanylate cyclase (GGDEF)-like protein
VTAQRQKEEEILYLNYHDVLTGLYNRAYFDMQQGQLDDSSHLPLSVILGDVDGLKLINDAFGHSEGDLLLKETAKIIKSCCREEDIVARISGDEFGILLPFTSSEEASSIMESIRSACQERVAHNDKTVPFTSTSLGFATKTAPDESLENVIKSAEEFMYRRKLLTHNSLHSTVMTSIEATLREKSNETEDHAQRLGSLAKELGRALNLSEGDLDALELASALHDIGKVSVDLAILIKPAMLNDEEWRIIRRHPEAGCRIAQAVPELRHIAEVILCHHEHWDGSGYPQGLSGENIPLLSRIVSLIDSYDAMTANRPYRMAITKREAAAEILRVAGTQFDPVIAEIFVKQVLKEDGDELMDEATNQ